MKLVLELVWMLLKTFAVLGVLVGVWAGSALYNARSYHDELERTIKIRVRRECLRPEYVKSFVQAEEFDVTMREMDLVTEKMQLMNRKADDLLDHVDHVESMRFEYTQGKVLTGGMGGPAPKKTSH